MNKEKIKTYIGFAIKSNAVCYGIDNLKKNIKLVLYNETISNNSIDKIKKFCEELKVLSIQLNLEDSKLLPDGVKVLGIKNINLAKAIMGELKMEEDN